LTLRGERFFEPNIGTLTNALLFETIDFSTASALKSEIENVINNNEPRVKLLEVIVVPDYDEGAMNVRLVYLIIGIDALPQQLEFVLLPTR